TLLPKEEIEAILEEQKAMPHQRALQKALAREVTILVHSEEDWRQAVEASEILFGKGTTELLQRLDENLLMSVMEGVPQVTLNRNEFTESVNVTDLLSELTAFQIFDSKGEAKKMIKGGGVSINKQKLTNPEQEASNFGLLQDKYLLVQKGKKNYYLVVLQ
ncbi:MAG: tyrosine--tRNA ligase, partial [Sphingobacteriales bacterium]